MRGKSPESSRFKGSGAFYVPRGFNYFEFLRQKGLIWVYFCPEKLGGYFSTPPPRIEIAIFHPFFGSISYLLIEGNP
jgi:hypothetical protein